MWCGFEFCFWCFGVTWVKACKLLFRLEVLVVVSVVLSLCMCFVVVLDNFVWCVLLLCIGVDGLFVSAVWA